MRLKPMMLMTTMFVSLPAVAAAQEPSPATPAPPQVEKAASTTPRDPADANGGTAIVVTGSRIRGANLVSTAPVAAVSAQELKLQGAFNVQDTLNRLPQIAADNTNTYNGGEGRQRVNLRRVGFNRTLTLLDGQRLGESEANDTNLIPVSLVERIDLLTGGASAVYGSDAIAGVVNFILKKDFDGVTANANYGFFNHVNRDNITTAAARRANYPVSLRQVNDGGNVAADLTVGKNFADGRGNISLFGRYNRRDEVLSNKRSYALCRLTVTGGAAACGQDTSSTTGYFSPRSGPNRGVVFTDAPDGSRSFVPFDISRNAFNVQGDRYLQRGGEQYNGGGFFRYEFDRAVEVYAGGLYSRDRSGNLRDLGGIFAGPTYLINCDNPLLSTQQAGALCGTQAGTAANVNTDVRYRFTPQRFLDLTNTSYRVNGGLRGDFGKSWHYDVNAVYSALDYSQRLQNENDPTKIIRALQVVNVAGVPTCRSVVDGSDPACVPLDIFRVGGQSQAAIDYIRYAGNSTGVFQKEYRQYVFNGNLTGDLGDYGFTSPFAKKGVSIALGAEHRQSTLRGLPDATYTAINGSIRSYVKTVADDIYGEIQMPLVEDQPFFRELSIGAALRGSKYFGIEKMQSTYKFDGSWRPIEDVLVRGSYNKATRAPNVSENNLDLSYGNIGVNSRGDPCAGTSPGATLAVCQLTGVTQAQYGRIAQCPDFLCTKQQGGGSAVVPETGRTYTVGMVLTPRALRGFSFSVDFYNIKITQPIGFYFANDFITQCITQQSRFACGQFVRNPDGSLFSTPGSPTGFVYQGRRNGQGDELLRGIDFQATESAEIGDAGRLGLDFLGTLLLKKGGTTFIRNAQTGLEQAAAYNTVGLFGPSAGVGDRRWQHTFRATFSPKMGEGRSSLVSLNWRHIGGVGYSARTGNPVFGTDDPSIPAAFKTIPAYDYFDAAVSVTIRQLTLRLTVNNLFDVTPPVRPRPPLESLEVINTVASLYDPLGRAINVGATIAF